METTYNFFNCLMEVNGLHPLKQKEYDLDRDSKLFDKRIFVLRIKMIEDNGYLIMKINETINALK